MAGLKISDGDVLTGNELNVMIIGIDENGVYTGAHPSANSPPDTSIWFSPYNIFVKGNRYTKETQTNLPVASSAGIVDRKDIAIFDTSEKQLKIVQGAYPEIGEPAIAPAFDKDEDILIAEISIPSGAYYTSNDNIEDQRVFINPSFIKEVDVQAIKSGIKEDGVYSGFAVTQCGAGPNMSVDVAPGTCYVGGTKYEKTTTTNVVVPTSDATYPRKDIIIYDTSEDTPALVEGDPSPNPKFPRVTNGDILLGKVFVDAGTGVISDSNITDGRVFVRLDKHVEDFNNHVEATTSVHGIGDTSKLYYTGKTIGHDYTLGDMTIKSTGSISVRNTTYQKKAQYTITELTPSPTNIRTYISCGTNSSTAYVYVTVYKNGEAIGSEIAGNNSGASITQDLSFAEGDTIELWAYSNSSDDWAQNAQLTIKGKELTAEQKDMWSLLGFTYDPYYEFT